MWHLYDYYLQSGGSYFGAKKANAAPLHLLYSYDSHDSNHAQPHDQTRRGSVAIVNSRYLEDGAGLTAEATQFDLSGKVLRMQSIVLKVVLK